MKRYWTYRGKTVKMPKKTGTISMLQKVRAKLNRLEKLLAFCPDRKCSHTLWWHSTMPDIYLRWKYHFSNESEKRAVAFISKIKNLEAAHGGKEGIKRNARNARRKLARLQAKCSHDYPHICTLREKGDLSVLMKPETLGKRHETCGNCRKDLA